MNLQVDEIGARRAFRRGYVRRTAFGLMWAACASMVSAQGITRSTGLGLRGAFWKINNHSGGVLVKDQAGMSSSVDVEGFGVDLIFFSRLHRNWFLESSIGALARVHEKETGLFEDVVDVSTMIPFLVGMRYDVLTGRIQSAIQPYVCAGVGTYWFVQTAVKDEGVLDEQVSVNSDFKFGGYSGLGTHLILKSWFALNFDARYHFVDFSSANPNSGFEFGFGFCFMWGQKREIFRVRSVKVIVEDIYPAYYRFYNTYPLAMAAIENTADFPIEVNLRSWIDRVTDGVRQSGFISIPKGATKDLPVYLLFGPKLLKAETREPAVINLEVEAKAGVTLTKSFSAQVTVHSRNAWNGEIDKLPVFVTPDDPEIIALTRNVVQRDTAQIPPALQKFEQARRLFDALSRRGIRYQSDPNIPFDRDDRVQFASATLSLGSGDCDDLSVLFSSVFESVGISTAFVDVRDPGTAQGHVYLLFDSGLEPEQGILITSNEKRTVVRERGQGKASLWIPLETTLVQAGFETAWKEGAAQFEEQGNLRQGLAEGWMKIIDVQ
jgi:outer membrane protein W